MFGISMWELLLAALLLFVLVGPKKLPEVAKTLAQALAKLRRSVDDMKKEVDLDEELDFIKEVRGFSPERLFDDIEPGRKMNPVEPPQGPEKKTRKQPQIKTGVKETVSARPAGRKQIKAGRNRRPGPGKRPVEKHEPEKLPVSEPPAEKGINEVSSAEEEKVNTKVEQPSAEGKRIMIKPGKTD